jgi:hypothetical protein
LRQNVGYTSPEGNDDVAQPLEDQVPNYCVNTQEQMNGDHEVHDLASTYGCLPANWNRRDLGYFSDCKGAVQAAKQLYAKADGCAYCSPACHTS